MAFKLPDFNDRAKAAEKARLAKLEKFKTAPPPSEEALAARARAAEKRQEREEKRKLERIEAGHGRRVSMNKEARQVYLSFATSPEALWPGNFRDLHASLVRMATLAPERPHVSSS